MGQYEDALDQARETAIANEVHDKKNERRNAWQNVKALAQGASVLGIASGLGGVGLLVAAYALNLGPEAMIFAGGMVVTSGAEVAATRVLADHAEDKSKEE